MRPATKLMLFVDVVLRGLILLAVVAMLYGLWESQQ